MSTFFKKCQYFCAQNSLDMKLLAFVVDQLNVQDLN